MNRGFFLPLRKKQRVYDLWKKQQVTQDHKVVVRLSREKRVTKAEEKTGVLNASLASVLKSKTKRFQGTQSTELEDRDWEQNEDPVTQGEAVSGLLHR